MKTIERDVVFTPEQFKKVGFIDTGREYGGARIYRICNQEYFITKTEDGNFKVGFNYEVKK